jgi:F-type H+-transporting ATPase subunit epsilon
MHVVIAQVDKVFFDGPARSLTAPGSEGVLTVLPRHMPLITTLKKGTLVVRAAEGEKSFPIESGILEVRPDGATVIL